MSLVSLSKSYFLRTESLRFISSGFDNYFLQAQRVQQLIRDDFDRIFSMPNFYFTDRISFQRRQKPWNSANQVDVLIHPSAIRTAPVIRGNENGSKEEEESDLESYVQDVLTVPASLAGIPALCVPVPNEFLDPQGDGWPIGVSVVGQWGSDELVMKVGEVIEQLGR